MKKLCSPTSRRWAFTLIELLVVIAIIGILAAMLFPAISKVKVSAQKSSAKTDMSKIGMAIKSYESDYNGRLPAPGIDTGLNDVTYGLNLAPLGGVPQSVAFNSNIVAVLMNWEKFPNGANTINVGKTYNPRNLTPLNPNLAKDNASGGVGPDGEYRDPWGNSYVITMDTSLNERCMDNFYSRTAVSQENGQQGFYGLGSQTNVANRFELPGQYMIWSRGPDGLADPAVKANKGVNQDNLLGWQQ